MSFHMPGKGRRLVTVLTSVALFASVISVPLLGASEGIAAADNLSAATATAAATAPAFTGQTTDGLVAGQAVHISADRTGTNLLYSIQARLCKSGASIQFDADFNPTAGGQCIGTSLGAGTDISVTATGTPGAAPTHAELDFRVGSGTSTYTMQDGSTASITCDATNPCEIWTKFQSSAGAAQYKHWNVTYAGTPGTPTGLGVAVGSGQATLNWTAPTNTGNAPVSSYTITYTPAGGSAQTTTSTTTSKTITGLTNFAQYSFSVKANTIGAFVSADTSAATGTPTPSGAASLSGVPAGGAISLSWTAPSTPGVTDYQVSYTPAGGSVTTVLTGSTGVTYTLSGLTNGTQYTVTVAAQYGAGNYTVASNAINVTPTAAVVGDSFTVVVPNGSLALTTAATGAINLGTAVLDTSARFWESTGALSAITVRDTRSTATQWSISIVSGNFTSGSNSFTGANLGVTPTRTSNTSDTAPVMGSVVAPRGGSGNAGLSTSRTFSSSAVNANLGEAVLGGTLKLSVPTSQAPGTYTGTLTITAL
jgi:hypothetical protein